MIISINQKQLKNGLKAVRKVLGMNKESKSLFSNTIKMEAKNSSLNLLGTNGETIYMWSTEESVKIDAEGVVGIVADKFITAIEALSGDALIELNYNSGIVYMKCGNREAELRTVEACDFPTFSPIENLVKFSFDTTKTFSKIVHTVGRDISKPRLLGLLSEFVCDGEQKKVVFSAVNPNKASRLIEKFESSESLNLRVVLPVFLVDEALEFPLKGLSTTKSRIIADFGDLKIMTPLPEDRFVNPENAFATPKDSKIVGFNRKHLIESLRYTRAMADKHDLKSKFIVNGDITEITSYTENSKSKDSLKSRSNEKMTFSLNCEYLIELLSCLNKEDIEFQVVGKGTSGQITYKTDNYQYVTSMYSQG
jgi:DNA polymerase III sliding clamp (beta) subunit (PCNA family)